MNIGAFFGSRSPEHDVSIITGQLIIQGLKDLGHNVIPVYVKKDGKWAVGEDLGNIDFFKQKDFEEKIKKYEGFAILPDPASKKLILKKNGTFGSKEYSIDVAFPAFHGQFGEDGTVQGLFEMMNIPYVGCDVLASAITMDKVLTKVMYQKYNIPTTNFIYFENRDWVTNKDEVLKSIEKDLKWPLIIKPARLGSSIGISKANNKEELEFSIEVALHYDDKVIVEDCVEDLMDLTVAVLGNENPVVSHIQESVYSKDFFSYEDKYLEDGGAQLGNADKKIIIPASTDDQTTKDIKDTATKVYKIFGCSGTARVDFLYSKTLKKFFVNEINPLPGTLYHHLWQKSGVELKDLLSQLVDLAKEKHEKKEKLTHTFDSAILNQASKDKMKLKGV